MYSIVMLMAMSTGGEAIDCHGRRGGCGGCYGGWGCGGCYGGAVKVHEKKSGGEDESKVSSAASRARLVVSADANAKITINGKTVKRSAETRRVFVSPTLQTGRDYVYNLKSEVTRDGETLVVEKKVTVRAGKRVKVELTTPEASVAQR